MAEEYDIIIIGAGLYGLYSAIYSAKKKKRVLVLEKEPEAFLRATYVNQARVHMGYHYPRSISTALKSRNYFDRFVEDYKFCILSDFHQVYATSSKFSFTDKKSFTKFCSDAGIMCEYVDPNRFFKKDMCDGAYLTKEYAFDANILKEYFLDEIKKHKNIEVKYTEGVVSLKRHNDIYVVSTSKENSYNSGYILNTTYASCNEIIGLTDYDPIKVKYELCEIILCDINDALKGLGITVMDGPFFSIMPFGKTGLHSLTSVTFTPHIASFSSIATFDCQKRSDGMCSPTNLYNCDFCKEKPKTAFSYMSSLARKYMLDKYEFSYKKSLFSIKPIMQASEVDDSRPTVIKIHSNDPTFVSVLSGKINTVYDLDEVLNG